MVGGLSVRIRRSALEINPLNLQFGHGQNNTSRRGCMVQRAWADDPGSMFHFVTPDVCVAVEYQVVLPRTDHGQKHFIAMPVSKTQTAPTDLEFATNTMAGVAEAGHRRP